MIPDTEEPNQEEEEINLVTSYRSLKSKHSSVRYSEETENLYSDSDAEAEI